jgi:hypothetical protein
MATGGGAGEAVGLGWAIADPPLSISTPASPSATEFKDNEVPPQHNLNASGGAPASGTPAAAG